MSCFYSVMGGILGYWMAFLQKPRAWVCTCSYDFSAVNAMKPKGECTECTSLLCTFQPRVVLRLLCYHVCLLLRVWLSKSVGKNRAFATLLHWQRSFWQMFSMQHMTSTSSHHNTASVLKIFWRGHSMTRRTRIPSYHCQPQVEISGCERCVAVNGGRVNVMVDVIE